MANKKTTTSKKIIESNVQLGAPMPESNTRSGMLAAATALDQARRSGELIKATNQIINEIKQLDAREKMEITNLQLKFAAERQSLQAQQAQLATFL